MTTVEALFMPEMEVSDVDETLKYTFAKTLVYGKNNVAVQTVSSIVAILSHQRSRHGCVTVCIAVAPC